MSLMACRRKVQSIRRVFVITDQHITAARAIWPVKKIFREGRHVSTRRCAGYHCGVQVLPQAKGVLQAMFPSKLSMVIATVFAIGALGLATRANIRASDTDEPTAVRPSPSVARSVEDPPRQKPSRRDDERLQGNWQLQRVEVNGVEIPTFFQSKEGDTVDFSGNKWTWVSNMEILGSSRGFTFKLDETKTPKAIDLRPLKDGDKTLLGIYQLNGDALKICCSMKGDQSGRLPSRAYWNAGTYTALIILKRQSMPPAGKRPQSAAPTCPPDSEWANTLFENRSFETA